MWVRGALWRAERVGRRNFGVRRRICWMRSDWGGDGGGGVAVVALREELEKKRRKKGCSGSLRVCLGRRDMSIVVI